MQTDDVMKAQKTKAGADVGPAAKRSKDAPSKINAAGLTRIAKMVENIDASLSSANDMKVRAEACNCPKKILGQLELRIAEMEACKSACRLAMSEEVGKIADIAKDVKEHLANIGTVLGNVSSTVEMLEATGVDVD